MLRGLGAKSIDFYVLRVGGNGLVIKDIKSMVLV